MKLCCRLLERSRNVEANWTKNDDVVVQYPDGGVYKGRLDPSTMLRQGKGDLSTPNGFRYKGDFAADVAEGYGTADYPGGHHYVGEWRGGERCGFGEFTTAAGDMFVGEWKGDVVHGHGRWTFPDGSFFEGIYESGERKEGCHSTKDGSRVYQGSFLASERHGSGLEVIENEWQYNGEWERDMRHGTGDCRYFHSAAAGLDAGARYHGGWKEDVRDGVGQMDWPSGEQYTGQWKGGLRHGKGRGQTIQGDVYKGDWVQGCRTGQGRCVFANGDKYEGEWELGLPHGFGTMLYCSGERYIGQWCQGKRHGKGKATFADGTKFKGMWEEDLWLQSAATPRLCRVTGMGLSRGEAGRTATFTVEARDECGQRRISGGEVFNIRIVQSPVRHGATSLHSIKPEAVHTVACQDGSISSVATLSNSPAVALDAPSSLTVDAERITVHDEGDGRYTVAYNIERAGLYQIFVEMPTSAGGELPPQPVADSPYIMRVFPSSPMLKHTVVTGEGRNHAVASDAEGTQKAFFKVQLRDQFFNCCIGALSLQQLPIQARLTGGSTGAEVAVVHVQGVPSQGVYLCSYTTPSRPGHSRLEIWVQEPSACNLQEVTLVDSLSSLKTVMHQDPLSSHQGSPSSPLPNVDEGATWIHLMPLKQEGPKETVHQPSVERHVPGSPFAVHILPRAQPMHANEGNASVDNTDQVTDQITLEACRRDHALVSQTAVMTGNPRLLSRPAAVEIPSGGSACEVSLEVVDSLRVWGLKAREAYGQDGDMEGWEEESKQNECAGRKSWPGMEQSGIGQSSNLRPHELEYVLINPKVPVVERLEDLWRLSKFQAHKASRALKRLSDI
ncbi:hypothetical protein CEUSTIGMA_g349.t1 [Chlamydomonas eustigma]|uniref:Uncharacterized protein n=1 Tax=Chlamydomonas eustigma TaxID=1157962 RepID=A0A250WPW5_9CHLO|nr:hypothetical protein CEUSTIGMA_g349.t1 [Chlamydomonas eustigma]|eukprot:GAX72894.1 hypothetical protein CEUSTIGMA_g349.t1 [Chlamydomonas eustigma]